MAKTADFYLRRKYGIPIDTVQTYLEHLAQGVPAPWYYERYMASTDRAESGRAP